MELATAQDKVKQHFTTSGFPVWPRFVVLSRLEEEISEIGRILSVEEGYRETWKVDNMDATDEFGDALFQLIHLANLMNVDLERGMAHAFKKYGTYAAAQDANTHTRR